MERPAFVVVLLFCVSSAHISIPFSFLAWTRAFRDCSLHLILTEWVKFDTMPLQEMEEPFQLVRITPSFMAKKIYGGLAYTRHIDCRASFIYEVTTNRLELGLGGSLQFGGPAVKYIFLLTFDPRLIVGSLVRELYGDPHLLIDFTRLYILHVKSILDGLPFVKVLTACPQKAGTVQICPVEVTSFATTELEFERRGRMRTIPYYPFSLVPYRGGSFHDSVWTDFESDDLQVKVNKEMLRSIHLGFSNESIDYDITSKTLNPVDLSRRCRISRGELKFMGGAGTFILTNQRAFGFLTCYKLRDQIAFHVYLEPFTLHVWLSTGVTCACLAFVLVKLFKLGGKHFLDTYMNLILALIEQYSAMKDLKAHRFRKYRRNLRAILLALWLVAALTLSNAYRSILTANVAAPVPTIGIETFEQLRVEGFELYSPLETAVRVYASNPQHWKLLLEKFRILMDQQPGDFNNPAVTLTVFGHHLQEHRTRMQHSQNIEYMHAKYVWKDTFDQYLKMLRLPEDFPNVTVEQVVASCGKTAYVNYDYELDNFVPPSALSGKWRESNGDLKLRVGSERLLSELQGWIFAQDFKGGGLLSSAFRRLTAEAGIHAALLKHFKVLRRSTFGYLLNSRLHDSNPIQLDANLIQGLFTLYGILLLAAFIAFAIELCAYRALARRRRQNNAVNKA